MGGPVGGVAGGDLVEVDDVDAVGEGGVPIEEEDEEADDEVEVSVEDGLGLWYSSLPEWGEDMVCGWIEGRSLCIFSINLIGIWIVSLMRIKPSFFSAESYSFSV